MIPVMMEIVVPNGIMRAMASGGMTGADLKIGSIMRILGKTCMHAVSLPLRSTLTWQLLWPLLCRLAPSMLLKLVEPLSVLCCASMERSSNSIGPLGLVYAII